MRRFLALLLLSTALVLGRSASPAWACSCVESTPAESAERSDAVFVGTLLDAEPEFPENDPDDAIDRITYTFAVETVYAGDVTETVEVSSMADSAACGAVFDEGSYLVYATVEEGAGELRTNLCSGNDRLDGSDPLPAELGEGSVPLPDGGEAPDDEVTEEAAPSTDPRDLWGPEGDVIDPGFLDTYGPVLAILAGVAVLGAAGTWILVRRRRSA